MSTWLEDLGTKKFNEKEMKLITDMLELVVSASEETLKNKSDLLEQIDNAIYNVTEMRKAVAGLGENEDKTK